MVTKSTPAGICTRFPSTSWKYPSPVNWFVPRDTARLRVMGIWPPWVSSRSSRIVCCMLPSSPAASLHTVMGSSPRRSSVAAPIAKRSRGTAWGFNPRSGIPPPSPPHPEGVQEQVPRPSVPQIQRIIRHPVTLQQRQEFLLDGLPESAKESGPWWRTRCGTPAGSSCCPWGLRRAEMRWPDCIMALAGFMGKPGDGSEGQSPPTPSGWDGVIIGTPHLGLKPQAVFPDHFAVRL